MHKIRTLLRLSSFLFLCIIVIITGLYTNAFLSKPIELNSLGTYSLYDNDENLIYQGSNIRMWTDYDDISKNVINAVLATEDKNFYKHNGFDYLRIIKAGIKNIKHKQIIEGASTISQQYIKNAYLDFDKSWSRKFKEAILTINLETHYSKEEILEAYLNTINYGNGNYGIGNAASFYFNKKPKDLSLEESIILAGIPKSPNNYNPLSNYDKSIARAKIVALAMYKNNLIDKTEYTNLFNEQIAIYGKHRENDLQTLMYFQDAALQELKDLGGFNSELINSGNLKIYTTLDFEAQKIMEEEMINNLKDEKLEFAGIIANPKDGSVLALTGGTDYGKSQYNRALSSKRQVGSTMKPFLYYAALNKGMTSSSTFLSQSTVFKLENGNEYTPNNWANTYGNKEITMAAAVAYSDNIYAVKTYLFLGEGELVKTAKKCGIKERLKDVPSLALGTSEINLMDFATGYMSFASGGYEKNLHLITKVTDEDNKVLYEYKDTNNLILNPNYVFIINDILTSTTNPAFIDYNSPTAISLKDKLSHKYALKTGTTDGDYWTVGYNPNIMMITWTGYDDNHDLAISVGNDAKNIWANTVEKISEINMYEKDWYKKPENVVGIPLNAISGKFEGDINQTNIFYYLKGSEPYYN